MDEKYQTASTRMYKVLPGQAGNWQVRAYGSSMIYDGHFAVYTRDGFPLVRIAGRIVTWPGLPADVYVFNPPRVVRQVSRGACLQLAQPGGQWFKLHWERPAHGFDESLAYVEGLLNEVPHRYWHTLHEKKHD
jgi:hypothetical protein